jgi:phage gpG-like protein
MSVVTSGIGGYLTVDFDLSGVNRFFDRLESELVDISGNALGQGFMDAGDSYMAGIRERFGDQSQGGGSWPPLSPNYAKQKLKRRGHELILVDTGELFLSLYPSSPNNIRYPLPDGIVVGTDDPKAHFHQYGTKKMPARPILVSPDDPDMPSTTLDDMTFDIERGLQKLIDECAAGF